MSDLPPQLLSAALRVKWERGYSGDRQAMELIAERLPGFSIEEYAEASRRAAALDSAAFDAAAAWFAGGATMPLVTAEELAAEYPGFPEDDYAAAISNNVMWARK